MNIFAGAVLALGALDAVLLAGLTWRRIRLAQGARRTLAVERELKPSVLAFLDGDGELPATLDRREQEVLADLLGGYGRIVRGAARGRIAEYFARQGTVERELAALAQARSAPRRAAAAHRLGDIGSGDAGPALIDALGDESRDVRTVAVRSLGRLGEAEAVEPLVAAAAERRVPSALVGWALLQIGDAALPALRRELGADEPLERAGALRLLGFLGHASDADLVAERLRDTAAPVRAAAAQALARLGGPRNFDALLGALEDRSPPVRAAAATALGRVRDRRALDRLLSHARDDQFEVAHAAAYSAAVVDLATTECAAAASSSPHLGEARDLAVLR